MARPAFRDAALAAVAALGLMVGCVLPPAAQATYCEGMGVRITASRDPNKAGASAGVAIPAKLGRKVKVFVTVINANTTHGIESASITLGLPAGVAYLRALADKSKGAAAMNGSVLPMPANEGLVWRGIGPLPASSGSDQANSGKGGASNWTQELELWPQGCAPTSGNGGEAVLSLFGVATLSGGSTCDLVSPSATLAIWQRPGAKAASKKGTCSPPLPELNLGLCTAIPHSVDSYTPPSIPSPSGRPFCAGSHLGVSSSSSSINTSGSIPTAGSCSSSTTPPPPSSPSAYLRQAARTSSCATIDPVIAFICCCSSSALPNPNTTNRFSTKSTHGATMPSAIRPFRYGGAAARSACWSSTLESLFLCASAKALSMVRATSISARALNKTRERWGSVRPASRRMVHS